jgi:phthalate 4,5-dioxygenase reductase component
MADVAVTAGLFSVRVAKVLQITQQTTSFVLVYQDGSVLPDFEPGSHITVRTPSGALRHYSLCGPPQGAGFWQIAVKREGRGRGGSVSLVDATAEGAELWVSLPENSFQLLPEAQQYLFIAGGIGITPILAMLHSLIVQDGFEANKVKLIYLCRDAASAAFLPELQAMLSPSSLIVHYDEGRVDRQLDLWHFFEKPKATWVYCCGPKPLMDSVKDMVGHWPQKQIHFESFGGDTAPKSSDETFQVTIASSGLTFDVEPGTTILQTLRANRIDIPSSCESGTCGSCKTVLLEGVADHRDLVLLDDEKDRYVMVCVSRAISSNLTLEL